MNEIPEDIKEAVDITDVIIDMVKKNDMSTVISGVNIALMGVVVRFGMGKRVYMAFLEDVWDKVEREYKKFVEEQNEGNVRS